MVFVKGQSGNPAGKPKGAKSEKTKAWEKLGYYIANEGAQKYLEYLEECEPEEYMKRFESTLEYFKPKLARNQTELTGRIVNVTTTKYGGNPGTSTA
jgi:hypothetical protein|tara:strand:+ start:497 stop:787 length:291 start_codon:yes stop_codon:yes gene_type:complete